MDRGKDIEPSTMLNENTIIPNLLHHYQNASIQGRQIQCRKDQMQVSHVEKKILALFLIVNLYGVLKSYFGLDLIDPKPR